jgi:uncharacterized damage-inducible protein DinB
MAIVDTLLPEFDHEMAVTRKLLERVPQDKWEWKPHPRSSTMLQLAHHLARLPILGGFTLNQTELEINRELPPEAMTRAELLALFDRHVADTRNALAGKSDAELMALWSLKKDGHTIFAMPKATVWRSFMMSHLIHHRGQLTVYLRMNDVPLPSIYGPSADEGGL